MNSSSFLRLEVLFLKTYTLLYTYMFFMQILCVFKQIFSFPNLVISVGKLYFSVNHSNLQANYLYPYYIYIYKNVRKKRTVSLDFKLLLSPMVCVTVRQYLVHNQPSRKTFSLRYLRRNLLSTFWIMST